MVVNYPRRQCVFVDRLDAVPAEEAKNKSATIRNSRAIKRNGGPPDLRRKLLKGLVAARGLEPRTYGL